jgi:hypothetical protein
VEKALLAVGTGITLLGGADPRKEAPGAERNHPLLASFLKALADDDDPAKRAHPANITIIDHLHVVLDTADPAAGRSRQHTIDLAIIGFFWLLRPAEYLRGAGHGQRQRSNLDDYLSEAGEGRSQAFRLRDITFHTATSEIAAIDPSLNDLDLSRISRATLKFYDQKNAVRGRANQPPAHLSPTPVPCQGPSATLPPPSPQRWRPGHPTPLLL